MWYNWIIGVFLITTVGGTLDPSGTKCGDKTCSTTEYCNPFDTHCRPCSEACDTSSHNHQPEICLKDCQGECYIHTSLQVYFTNSPAILMNLISFGVLELRL